ncbi:MAG: PIG-L deacetylase family protein [Planctomycetota bacterium]|jgi:LmbE family N-acetylglucosaminyl deacetylase
MDLPTDDKFSVPPMPEIRDTPVTGRVLCFAPHPDDEAFGPGGTLYKHRLQGDDVRIVLASDGSAGDPDGRYEQATYTERRRQESRTGMAVLDCKDFVFWGLPDSCEVTDADLGQLATRTVHEIEQYKPDIVYMPWEGEGNADHRALYCGVLRGLERMNFAGKVFGYEIWNMMVPDLIVDICAVAEKKWQAMRAYETQLAYVDCLHVVQGANAHRALIFNRGLGYGEAFRKIQVARA